MRQTTHDLGDLLERFHDGDAAARNDLLTLAYERLRILAHRMLGQNRVRLWNDATDVLHESLLRLIRAMEELRPATIGEFYQLAGLQMRRVLIDMTRNTVSRLMVASLMLEIFEELESIVERQASLLKQRT